METTSPSFWGGSRDLWVPLDFQVVPGSCTGSLSVSVNYWRNEGHICKQAELNVFWLLEIISTGLKQEIWFNLFHPNPGELSDHWISVPVMQPSVPPPRWFSAEVWCCGALCWTTVRIDTDPLLSPNKQISIWSIGSPLTEGSVSSWGNKTLTNFKSPVSDELEVLKRCRCKQTGIKSSTSHLCVRLHRAVVQWWPSGGHQLITFIPAELRFNQWCKVLQQCSLSFCSSLQSEVSGNRLTQQRTEDSPAPYTDSAFEDQFT